MTNIKYKKQLSKCNKNSSSLQYNDHKVIKKDE